MVLRLSCNNQSHYSIIMTLPFKPSYLWIDLEMSGLNSSYHRILELACILTDDKLKHRQEGPHLILQCDSAHLQTMDEWCTKYSLLYADITESQVSPFLA